MTAHLTHNDYVTKARLIRIFPKYFEIETKKRRRKVLSLSLSNWIWLVEIEKEEKICREQRLETETSLDGFGSL